jgi:hypothetical protein
MTEEALQFPGGSRPSKYPKPMTLDAVRLLVHDMLNYAADSPDAYFEVGPIHQLKDGGIVFDFQGLDFRITVEASPEP